MTCTFVFALVASAVLFCDGLLTQDVRRQQPQGAETSDGALDAPSLAHLESKRGIWAQRCGCIVRIQRAAIIRATYLRHHQADGS